MPEDLASESPVMPTAARTGAESFLEELIGDFREALSIPSPASPKFCLECLTDHVNERRLNRAVLFLTLGRLKQLAAVLAHGEEVGSVDARSS